MIKTRLHALARIVGAHVNPARSRLTLEVDVAVGTGDFRCELVEWQCLVNAVIICDEKSLLAWAFVSDPCTGSTDEFSLGE